MKTTILTLVLVFTFCTPFSFSNNLNIELEEESYIDDIPFNTEEIVSNIQGYSANPLVLTLEEENYIDDIPFDTYEVSISSLDYYQIIFSNMSNEIQSFFNNYYDEQIENLTRSLFEGVLMKIEIKSIEILNVGTRIVFPFGLKPLLFAEIIISTP